MSPKFELALSKQTRYQNRVRKQAINNLGGCCSKCGSKNNLEIHHTNHDGWADRISGDKRTYVRRASKGDIHGLSCLCKTCHDVETKKHHARTIVRDILQLEKRYEILVG